MKIFLDANVLFSAALPAPGAARALLVAARAAQAQCVCSDHAMTEARRNVQAKAPHALITFELIEALTLRVPEPAAAFVEAARDAGIVAKDAPVFGAALQCRADAFVTGDARHFGHLFGKRCGGVLVLSLRAALDRVAALAPPAGAALGKAPGKIKRP